MSAFLNTPSKDAWLANMAQTDRDVDLVRRMAGGDERALRELYAAYGQRMYAYALRLVEDPAVAQDVVQDALIAAWRDARKFRGEGRVVAWLLGMVHHLSFKALRRRPLPLGEELENGLPSGAAAPEELAQASQQSAWVREGLRRLSPEHRAALELVFYQGLALEEAAEVCGCPLGTLKSRLSYARQHLRGILSRQAVEDWL